MGHIVFPKIKALYDTACEGLLEGEVLIQEKIDGANLSIWIDEEKGLCIGSRKNEIYSDLNGVGNTFRGAVEYVRTHEGINTLLKNSPHLRLYGEWLVPHTLQYATDAYNHFYIFDIYDHRELKFIPADAVIDFATHNGILFPQVFCTMKNPDLEDVMQFVGKTNLGEEGEGVVIKRLDGWTNKWEEHQYGKIVTEKFKESNSITFGGNNKHADSYIEQFVVNKYCTEGRLLKIINKILINKEKEALDKSDTPGVLNMMEHDIVTEEMWNIYKKFSKREFSFNSFKRICNKKTRIMFHLFVEGKTSVAFNEDTNE